MAIALMSFTEIPLELVASQRFSSLKVSLSYNCQSPLICIQSKLEGDLSHRIEASTHEKSLE